MPFKNYRNARITSIKVEDGILRSRIETARRTTIPTSLEKCRETGRIDAFRLNWKPGMPHQPHIFWDSDVAKVLEGFAKILALFPDKEAEKEYDKLVDLIVSSQQPDGYLNSYFTTVCPEKRWTNLAGNHELYCAGHLMEAAVAAYELLGKRKLLDAMERYADLIADTFGTEPGKKNGYPGHEEIELALVRMFHATGKRKYLDLANYFIGQRGKRPCYYSEVEKTISSQSQEIQVQADAPILEQKDAHGHAVRAAYLYCGAADVACLTKNEQLFDACVRLFDSIVNRRMYITGGIGSTFAGEAFTKDYDLQNGSLMYAESCAAMGLARFASRMLNATGDGRYADIVEKCIFNGVLSGISISGDRFFYTNYLEVDDNTTFYNAGARERQEWFGCSCCPTSFCRFIPEMPQYIWSEGEGEIRLNIPVANKYDSAYGTVLVSGNYPYDGQIRITFSKDAEFLFSLRVPNWCGKYSLRLNGERVDIPPRDGYIEIRRAWKAGDSLAYELDMPVRKMRANFKVANNAGRIAIMRGPLVYALETIDNPFELPRIVIASNAQFTVAPAKNLPAGTPAIEGEAWLEETSQTEPLYFEEEPSRKPVRFTAIPYFLWQNRGACNMAVWIRSER